MTLAFDPCYHSNTEGGTDVRNCNGELKGWTERLPHETSNPGMFAAMANDPDYRDFPEELYATNDEAIRAILEWYASR